MPRGSPAPKRIPKGNRGRRVSPPQNHVSSGGRDSGNLPVTSPQGPNEEAQDNAAGAVEFDTQKYVLVKLSDIRKEVECPICLGIIRKTRTVMECMHRFCKECIDKSMRLGIHECPACRTHCPSRRSMRDDPNYDALIAMLYPNVDLYEEEEFTWREDEREKNKKIQTSIAGTYRRQSEAVAKKRSLAKENQSSNRIVASFNEDFHPHLNFSTDSSSPDVRHKRNRRSGPEIPPDLVDSSSSASSEDLAWRSSGARSGVRRGSAAAKPNSSRVTRIVDLLRASEENEDALDVHLTLLPEKGTDLPSLPRPHLCCRSTVSIHHIRRFVALHVPIGDGDLEILVDSPEESGNRKEQRLATADETLAGLVSGPNLVLVYRLKSG